MIEEISKIVSVVTLFQLGILIFVVLYNSQQKFMNRFLVGLLSVNSILVFVNVTDKYELIAFAQYPYLDMFLKTFFLLIGPLVFLHTLSICNAGYTLRKKDWLHLLPPLFTFIYLIIDYQFRMQNNADPSSVVPHFSTQSFLIFFFIFLLFLLLYIVLAFRAVSAYKKQVKFVYSSIEKVNLHWVHVLLVVLFFHWMSDSIFPVLTIMEIWDQQIYMLVDAISVSSLLAFSVLVVIKGLTQSPVLNLVEFKPKYAESNLSSMDSKRYLSSLKLIMETQKPFLNPSLKIIDLAESLSIPPKTLSQVINQEFGNNFFDFINKYRVEEAKNKLKNYNAENKTILEILFDSGFNSKAAFNRAFKKHTGYTPSAFKNEKSISAA